VTDGLEVLRAQVGVTRRHWRLGEALFLVLAAVCVAGSLSQRAWGAAILTGAIFGGLALLGEYLARKCDWDRNPLLRNLRDDPGRIATIEHRIASSSSGAFAHSFLQVKDDAGHHFAFRVPDADKARVLAALRRRCQAATFSGPGFER
jgi:hypothetical protein